MKTNEFLEKEIKNENWLPIEGYEGSYEVSDLGRVRSLNYKLTGKVRILKPVNNGVGYLSVDLCKDGKSKRFTVHRLVATAFVPNMFGDECVNHINEDKTDNRADNLMWCNYRENNIWGTRRERVTMKTSKPVLQFSKDGEFIREWPSVMEVQRVLGYFSSNISNCCLCRRKSAYGFVWKYL